MKKFSIFLIVLSLVLCFASCEKENSNNTFRWDETGCADPWPQDSDDTNEERMTVIETYLANQDIKVKNIRFEFEPSKQQFCEACFCTTGKVIVISVPARDNDKMKTLGFY